MHINKKYLQSKYKSIFKREKSKIDKILEQKYCVIKTNVKFF